MSKQRVFTRDISSLKRLAKANKRCQGISHSEALNRIAIQKGYSAWSHLQAEAVDTERLDQLLREFADGKRELPHLKVVLRLWEQQATTPEIRPIVNSMLSQLDPSDELAIIDLLPEHNKNHSPRDLNAAIRMARLEREEELLDKAELFASGKVEREIDKIMDDREAEEELVSLMSPIPLSTANMIWNYRFAETLGSSASTLANDIELYKRNRDNINTALLLVAELDLFRAFSDSQALNKWLVTPYSGDDSGRCPLDALWNSDALVLVDQYAANAREIFQLANIEEWRSSPAKVPPEVRHLLDNTDIALRNFSTIENAVFSEAIPEMARKLEEAMKPIEWWRGEGNEH